MTCSNRIMILSFECCLKGSYNFTLGLVIQNVLKAGERLNDSGTIIAVQLVGVLFSASGEYAKLKKLVEERRQKERKAFSKMFG